MGYMPDSIADLERVAPDVAEHYVGMREQLLAEPADGAGLPLKYRHLVMAVLDCVGHHGFGSKQHARAAVRAGATLDEVRDALLLPILTNGMPTWGNYGRHAFAAAQEALEATDDPER
jgi:alkylhydroperoxidase/carboxymuconolactone decarboxylase family protein YurZ